MSKTFHLGDVLSITTGRLVSNRHIDGIYDILGYMTGESLFTHQLPRAMNQCRPWLCEQHPQLADVDVSDLDAIPKTSSNQQIESAVRAWLNKQVSQFGELLEVQTLPDDEKSPRDPVQELVDMVGRDRVIVVEAPQSEGK